MLGKTHKAFGLATLATSGILYSTMTGKNITNAFVPQFNDFVNKVSDTQTLEEVVVQGWTYAQLLEYDSISVGSYIITIALMIGAIMGASYPDIDQKIPIKHRGITHSLWAVLLLIALTAIVGHYNPFGFVWTHVTLLPWLIGTIIGYMSHLIADAFSTSGIDWFYPLNGYKKYPGGAEVVKGNRTIFQPIYKVGQKFFGIPGSLIWGLIALITTILWLFTI